MVPIHPANWEVPSWHRDYGDPEAEVEMLRRFSVKAIQTIKGLQATLEVPEDGYLNVDMFFDSTKIAEIHIVTEDNVMKFGLFTFNGDKELDEIYFQHHQDGLQELKKHLNDKKRSE